MANSFYGNNSNLSITFDKIYSNYTEMIADIDNIFLNRYVFINYNLPTKNSQNTYEENKKIDEDNQYGFNHLTVWKKSLINKSGHFLKIGSFDLSVFEGVTAGVNYREEGFNKEKALITEDNINSISVSGTIDNENNTLLFTFNIPAIGNAISNMWNQIYPIINENTGDRDTSLEYKIGDQLNIDNLDTLAENIKYIQQILGYKNLVISADDGPYITINNTTCVIDTLEHFKVFFTYINTNEYDYLIYKDSKGKYYKVFDTMVGVNSEELTDFIKIDNLNLYYTMLNILELYEKVKDFHGIAIGKNLEGVEVFPLPSQSTIAGTHAEIFNDYSERIFEEDGTVKEGNVASGNYSHAEGRKTTARGAASHAEGYKTTAEDQGSHAEGWNTNAKGRSSHAEGYGTNTSGYFSHAEGYKTTAKGISSHVEGEGTNAEGSESHAEGYNTTASGGASHAEGNGTQAAGDYSHAEGSSIAVGEGSHAEGKTGSIAIYRAKITTTTDKEYIVEGISYDELSLEQYIKVNDSVSRIKSITVENGYTFITTEKTLSVTPLTEADAIIVSAGSIGSYSHTEGYHTTAFGDYSHAGGIGTIAEGLGQTVIGQYNQPNNTDLFIIGNGVDANNRYNALCVDEHGYIKWEGRRGKTWTVDGKIGFVPFSPGSENIGLFVHVDDEDMETMKIYRDFVDTNYIRYYILPGANVDQTSCFYHIGSSRYPWSSIVIKNSTANASYTDGEGISSDKRLKEVQSQDIIDKSLRVYDNLTPVSYKYKNIEKTDDFSRTHIGFLAQDVEEEIEKQGLTSEDCALVQILELDEPTIGCPDSKKYYLNYNELHGLHALKNQQQDARICELEDKVSNLENELAEIKALLLKNNIS